MQFPYNSYSNFEFKEFLRAHSLSLLPFFAWLLCAASSTWTVHRSNARVFERVCVRLLVSEIWVKKTINCANDAGTINGYRLLSEWMCAFSGCHVQNHYLLFQSVFHQNSQKGQRKNQKCWFGCVTRSFCPNIYVVLLRSRQKKVKSQIMTIFISSYRSHLSWPMSS